MTEYICRDCNTKVTTHPWRKDADNKSRFIDNRVCPCCGANEMESYRTDELTVVDIHDAFDAIEGSDDVIAIQKFRQYFGPEHTDRIDELMHSLQDRGEVNISADDGDFYNVELSYDPSDPHGFLPEYVTPVSDYRGVIKR